MLRTGATAGTPYSYTIYQVLTGNTKKACVKLKPYFWLTVPDIYTLTAGVSPRLRVLQLRGGQHPGRERELRLPRDQPRPAPRHSLTATPTVEGGQGRDTRTPGPAPRHTMPRASWSPHPGPVSVVSVSPGSSLVLMTEGASVLGPGVTEVRN